MNEEQAPEKVIDKLKKLLRLAGSGNPNEAALALARAMEMAEKWRVELASLQGEDVEEIVKELFPQRREETDRWVWTLVMRYFHVRIVVVDDTFAYIGKETDIPFAKFVFDYLTLNFKLSWMTYKFQEKLRADGRKDSFYQGLYEGVSEKLKVVKEEAALGCEKYALALQTQDEQLKQATAKFFPELTFIKSNAPKTDNEKARAAGGEAGRKIQISRPLEGKASQRALGN